MWTVGAAIFSKNMKVECFLRVAAEPNIVSTPKSKSHLLRQSVSKNDSH
jgi:hypothetical protein